MQPDVMYKNGGQESPPFFYNERVEVLGFALLATIILIYTNLVLFQE